ncbi:MAG: sugar-binding protein [Myxococcota bacterium]
MSRWWASAAAAVLVLLGAPVHAQSNAPAFFDPPSAQARKRLQVVKVTTAPSIDGDLSDAAWAAAPKSGPFVQVEPRQGEAATHESQVRVTFDDDALYVGARLEQPGGWKAFNQRDMRRDFATNECDSFAVILDTFGDGRNAFSFQVNPWGAQRDMQVVDDTLFEDKWDTVWRSATRRDDAGWTVELAIPWKSLRFGPNGTTWGIQFYRCERGLNEDTAWSPYPRNVSPWRMPYAGVIDGLTTPPPRLLTLQVRPYAIARGETVGDAPPTLRPSGGGEVTWTPVESAVVDLTVNTDFAETDVDRRVVNLSRFSVFFPERRQFFLESAGVFASGMQGFLQPFFSRAIGLSDDGGPVPILVGGRAVYRTPSRSAGALFVSTLATDEAQASVFGVGRYSHNLGEQSRVGGMLVMRHDLPREGADAVTNVVPVVDGLFRAGPVTLEGAGMFSSTATTQAPATFGGAGTVSARLQGNWGWLNANFLGVSPRFEARTGFVARPDIVGVGLNGGLDYRPEWLPQAVRSIGPFVDHYTLWGAGDGRFQETNIYFSPLWVLFQGGDESWLYVEKSTQALSDAFEPVPGVSFGAGDYDYARYGWAFLTQASRKASVEGDVSGGTYYSASTFSARVRASVQPIPHVSVAAQYGYNRFWGPGVTGDFADTHLVLVESRLALNPKLQLIGSYQRDTAGNASVLNARLAWEFLPLSFLYVVFTDTRGAYGAPDAPVAEQRLVVKATYTWRP